MQCEGAEGGQQQACAVEGLVVGAGGRWLRRCEGADGAGVVLVRVLVMVVMLRGG